MGVAARFWRGRMGAFHDPTVIEVSQHKAAHAKYIPFWLGFYGALERRISPAH